MTSTFSSSNLEVLRNRTFDEIKVGDRARIERTLTAADIQLFAAMSGDIVAGAAGPSPAEDKESVS
jgi:phosphate acetyltransferase/phosphate butyryltransferase